MNDPKPGIYEHFKGGKYRLIGSTWPFPNLSEVSSRKYSSLDYTHRDFLLVGYAKHSENGQAVQVYKYRPNDSWWTGSLLSQKQERLCFYESLDNGKRWVRPLEMWYEYVEVLTWHPLGCAVPRFNRIGD